MKCKTPKTITMCCVVAALGTIGLLSPTRGTRAEVAPAEQRIANAQERFNAVLAQNPQQMVDAAIFFANDMSPDQVRSALDGGRFSVRGFRHGTQAYSGGYIFQQGENLNQAIQSYARDHILFLTRRVQMENQILNTEKDQKLREAVAAHHRDALQTKTDFEKHGLRIIGLDVSGRAADLQDFRIRKPFVRVIELKEKDRPQPAILPQQ